MIRPIIMLRRRQLLVDVDTQKDLFLAGGKRCIRNHRRVLANIRRVMAWARQKNIKVISTELINSEKSGKNYCIEGTVGQEKISYTIRNRHKRFLADGYTDLPRGIFKEYDQVILRKRCPDPFNEPRAERMLSEIRVDEFIVIGALTEEAVKATVLGLLKRKKRVTLLTDAIGYREKNAAELALRQMEAKGAKLIDSKSMLGASCLRVVGVCSCERCRGKLLQNNLSKTIESAPIAKDYTS